MLSAIESAKLLLLGHCGAGFQTLGPHNPNQPLGSDTCGLPHLSRMGRRLSSHGAVPDIIVPQTPEAEPRNEDEQLRAAVEDLLVRLD